MIIKNNYQNKTYIITCPNCSSILEIENSDLGDNPQLEDVDYYLSERYNMNEIYFMYATSGTININEMNNNFNKLY